MLILYHAFCSDGFTAAWIAHKAYGDQGHQYIPVVHGNPPPDVAGHHVLMLDFCYPLPIMEQMIKEAASVKVMDHHKTAIPVLEAIKDRVSVKFNINKSGAGLALEHLPRNNEVFEPFVEYIQDRDLWTWKLEWSKEASAVIDSYDYNFTNWDHLNHQFEHAFDIIKTEGIALLRLQKRLVNRIIDTTMIVEDGIPTCNSPIYQSEIGNAICQGKPYGMIWYQRHDGQKICSLRSDPNGQDVSEIAKKLGGGGHKHAASYNASKLVSLA